MLELNDIIIKLEDMINAKGISRHILPDDILSEYGIDSFQLIQLIVELEAAFDIEFEAESLTPEVLKSIRSLSRQVELLLNK